MTIEMQKVVPWSSYAEESMAQTGDRELILRLHRDARGYLEQFSWCASIKEEYVGMIYAGIVAIFLFKIEPARVGVDEWIWVVVGDLPPAYITCEEGPNPASALDAYIGAMDEWVNAAKNGISTNGLIPANVAPTPENAEALQKRLVFLDERILSQYRSDLVSRS